MVDWVPNKAPPFVEKELRAFFELVSKVIRDDATGADKYDRIDELIWPVMDDKIVLV